MSKSILINGKRFDFIGAEDDFYFQNLDTFHEKGDTALIRYLQTIDRDAVSLDIGANIGVTALAIEAFTPGGSVYAFEPSPRNLPYLRANLRANASNVQVVGVAVGDRPGVASLSLPPTGAHSSVIRGGAPDGPNVATVPVTSIDDWMDAMQTQGLGRIDFIKIDVEGFEPHAISGAAATIARWRPDILLEFNSVAIAFESRISPLVFAEQLSAVFELYDGPERIDNIRHFVHMNMVKHGCVNDIILKLRRNADAVLIRYALHKIAK